MRSCWNWQTGMTKDHVVLHREGSSTFFRTDKTHCKAVSFFYANLLMLHEELYIINNEKKYVKISYNQENHREFYIEKKLFNSFDEMINELEIYNFIFDEKIRVIYALDNAVPTSFITIINEVK